MNEEKITHKRLVTFTQPLFEELKRLGYKEIKEEGHGLKRTKTFQKDNKFVETSHMGMILYIKQDIPIKKGSKYELQEMKDQRIVSHEGLTIHDEILKFFTNRTPTTIDNE